MSPAERAADYLGQAGGEPAQEARAAIARGDLPLAFAMVRELQVHPAYRGNIVAACVDYARRELARSHCPESPRAGVERLTRFRSGGSSRTTRGITGGESDSVGD